MLNEIKCTLHASYLTLSMAYETRRLNAASLRALQEPAPNQPIPHIDTYFFKVHSNVLLPSTPRHSQRYLSCRFVC